MFFAIAVKWHIFSDSSKCHCWIQLIPSYPRCVRLRLKIFYVSIWKGGTTRKTSCNVHISFNFESRSTKYSYFNLGLKNSSFRLPYQRPSSWRHKWSSFTVILAHAAWPRAQPLGQSVSLKFSLETGLESESFEPLIDFLAFLVQKLWSKINKLINYLIS